MRITILPSRSSLAVILALVLVVSACGGPSGSDARSSKPGTPTSSMTAGVSGTSPTTAAASATMAAKSTGRPSTASDSGDSGSPAAVGGTSNGGLQGSLDQVEPYHDDAVEAGRGDHEGIAWQLWVAKEPADIDVEIKQAYWLGGLPRRSGAGAQQTGSPIDVTALTSREPEAAYFGTISLDTVRVRAHMLDGREVDVTLIQRPVFSKRYFVTFLSGQVDYFAALGSDGSELGRDKTSKPVATCPDPEGCSP